MLESLLDGVRQLGGANLQHSFDGVLGDPAIPIRNAVEIVLPDADLGV